MTKKIIIDLDVFKNLIKMLNSTPDDRNIAFENIKNMESDELYHRLFLKALIGESRTAYRNHFELNWKWEELTIIEIYNIIKKNSSSNKENFQKIFESVIGEEFISLIEEYNFIELKTKILW